MVKYALKNRATSWDLHTGINRETRKGQPERSCLVSAEDRRREEAFDLVSAEDRRREGAFDATEATRQQGTRHRRKTMVQKIGQIH